MPGLIPIRCQRAKLPSPGGASVFPSRARRLWLALGVVLTAKMEPLTLLPKTGAGQPIGYRRDE